MNFNMRIKPIVLMISLALLCARIGAEPVPGVAALTVADPEQFRILQLTDLHFFSREKSTWDDFNQRTVDQMRKLVSLTVPDLIIITGDVWSEDQDGQGEAHMRYATGQFEALGVPWAFVWGNHDQLSDIAVAQKVFSEAKHSLYRGADSDGNYAIDILNAQGRRVWQILCINGHREGIQRNEQQWLRGLPKIDTPRFAFFHIPLQQYAETWKNGSASGIWGEDPCMEKEDGSSLPFLKSAGVTACFCGHDHCNDYSGPADGVELVYGRVSRSGGYGSDTFPKGGKLVTVNCSKGTFFWESVTPDGQRWRPKPGERVVITD